MKLVVALDMLNECFNLMKDQHTKIHMLHQVVYILVSEFKWLGYEGFYTMIEMPFVGTLLAYKKQGVTHQWVSAIKQVLVLVPVEKQIIPTIASLLDTRKSSFLLRLVDP